MLGMLRVLHHVGRLRERRVLFLSAGVLNRHVPASELKEKRPQSAIYYHAPKCL